MVFKDLVDQVQLNQIQFEAREQVVFKDLVGLVLQHKIRFVDLEQVIIKDLVDLELQPTQIQLEAQE